MRHTLVETLRQWVAQIACGYEEADDCDTLRDDMLVKLFARRDPEARPLASQPTMSRMENNLTNKELWDIGNVFVNHFVSSYKKAPKTIVLDCDDTNANTYGGQQLTLFNGYYGEYCYMPLLVTKMMLSAVRVEAKKCSIHLHFQQGHLFRKQLEWVLRMAG